MDLIPNSEQQQIIDSSARFLADHLPVARLHTEDEDAFRVDDQTWQGMADLGWFALGLEERLSGIGYTLSEEVLLLRELGRQIGPLSVMATMLAARVAALAGRDKIVQELLSGAARAGIANRVGACENPGSTLTGDFQLIDGEGARYLISLSQTCAMLIDARALPETELSDCLDTSTSLRRVNLEKVEAACRIEGEEALSVFRRGLILTAAMQTGQAMACRDMAVEYSKTRVQFDRPIGFFQAVKHRCSNMAVRCEAADSLTIYASVADVGLQSDAPLAAISAKLIAGDAAKINAADNVQIHGAIGFTAEYDAHLFVKRSHLMDLLFSPPAVTRQLILR
jgi:alkylation response protein AidB-like acyl-CoA dehydrogenase